MPFNWIQDKNPILQPFCSIPTNVLSMSNWPQTLPRTSWTEVMMQFSSKVHGDKKQSTHLSRFEMRIKTFAYKHCTGGKKANSQTHSVPPSLAIFLLLAEWRGWYLHTRIACEFRRPTQPNEQACEKILHGSSVSARKKLPHFQPNIWKTETSKAKRERRRS